MALPKNVGLMILIILLMKIILILCNIIQLLILKS